VGAVAGAVAGILAGLDLDKHMHAIEWGV